MDPSKNYHIDFSRCHRNDWICSSCKMVNYGNDFSKVICKCGQTKWGSKQFPKGKYTWRIGDILCGKCNQWNFKSNVDCKSCKAKL